MKSAVITTLLSILAIVPQCAVSFINTPFFSPRSNTITSVARFPTTTTTTTTHLTNSPFSDNGDDNYDDDDPYAEMKRQYPDLEFVDYSDPEYVVDQGLDDAPLSGTETEAKIEEMREERRRRNDEYQFETYFRKAWREGAEFRGEWSVLNAVFEEGAPLAPPRFRPSDTALKVISTASKVILDPETPWRVDGEAITHTETLVTEEQMDPSLTIRTDETSGDLYIRETAPMDPSLRRLQNELEEAACQPVPYLYAGDFRGPQGNMVVGVAHTTCASTPLSEGGNEEGPYKSLRAEVGICVGDARLRVKFVYNVDDTHDTTASSSSSPAPPLKLSTVTVCRELVNQWPSSSSDDSDTNTACASLYGPPGARGGLYDPPPVGGPSHARRYLTLDLEGRATVLFPYAMDQDASSGDSSGWVMSLDWTPGTMRYQVDRKVFGGVRVKSLYRLELSEVRDEDADEYRPRDGGVDMRQ